ncbi:family 10 glycosylhydrolase [Poriferisphaera sp. WC338]|uniref:family 10 glycosylhydrolase n=1 Tax=Poriferisphaera sp. WC338 TaxID=3425129 RepID=UPI003D8133C1
MTHPLLTAICAASMMGTLATTASAIDQNSDFADYRGIWISRFEYGSSASVDKAIYNSKYMGFSDVTFQVRGQGDAYYNSNFEPQVNSFDALDRAINQSHGMNMKLSAWINTMPLWNGSTPPSDPNHPWNAHPEWRLKKADGSTQPPQSGYVTGNPALPAFQDHINNIVNDIATNYDVDGINLDYIRMISGAVSEGYMRDAATVAIYTAEKGAAPDFSSSWGRYQYERWIASKITGIVERSKNTLHAAKPDAVLSADTWANPISGSAYYQQDGDDWAADGTADMTMVMNYTNSNSTFLSNLQKYPDRANRQAAVVAGIGTYAHADSPTGSPQRTIDQINIAKNNGANGYQIFSYESLVNSNGTLNAYGQAIREYNRALLADKAEAMTIESFDNGSTNFDSSLTFSGSTSGISNGSTAIVAGGKYGTSAQQISFDGNSNWTLRHVSGKGKIAAPEGNTEFFAGGFIGFWLKTSDANMQTAIVLDDPLTGERGNWLNVIADGEWHLYEWNLEDDSQWNSFAGGNGAIDMLQLTMDSIMFKGSGNANFMLDLVAYNPDGSIATIPEPASAALLLTGLIALTRRKRQAS